MGAVEVRVPDIGDTEDAEIVEILVAAGDRVDAEDPLVSVESDKATLEIPSPQAGVVESVAVAIGDKVEPGTLLLVLRAEGHEVEASARIEAPAEEPVQATKSEGPAHADEERRPGQVVEQPPPLVSVGGRTGDLPHASPLVRRQARELGVDIALTSGTGAAGRVLPEDLTRHVRGVMSGEATAPSAAPAVDFARFGPVEEIDRSHIRRVSARHLLRSWQHVPHVTQHDSADVTELEEFRQAKTGTTRDGGVKLTLLPFVMKACVQALRAYPEFGSSLSQDGARLIVKHYMHFGVAVDTENGLVAPVVRDVDQKGLLELAEEVAELSERARARKLAPLDLEGGVFTISNLGGIGGTAFSPIVNAPEVAALGLARLDTRPIWDPDAAQGEGGFVPRQVLPLCLSYDHRVIDGAAAARFTTRLRRDLSKLENLLL